jgi:hypothetical protein
MFRALLRGLTRGLILLVVIGAVWWLYRSTNPQAGDATGEVVVVSAEKLAEDYAASASQADTLYKGRRLRVSGTVRSVEIGPALKLAGETPFATVWARLPPAQSEALARLGKDARVDLSCVGGGVSQRMPLLYECVLVP